jgi:delta24-sterol reductase
MALYAAVFMDREMFGRMFDMRLYNEVRAKFQCLDAFPDLYDKINKQTKGMVEV